MFDKKIALLGIVITTAIAFVVALIASSATNQAMTSIEENLEPMIKDNPQMKSTLETGKTLDNTNDLTQDVQTLQKSPSKGLKNNFFVYPIMVILAGAVLFWQKLNS